MQWTGEPACSYKLASSSFVSHTQKEIAIKGMCFVRVTQISKAHMMCLEISWKPRCVSQISRQAFKPDYGLPQEDSNGGSVRKLKRRIKNGI